MKLSRFSNVMFTCCVTGILTFTNAFANTKSDYAAVISFPDEDSAKWLVHGAYMNLAAIDKKIYALSKLTVDALNGTHSSTDMYYLDLKFQSGKHSLDNLLIQSTTGFQVFSDNELQVVINDDGNGQHFVFDLPKITVQDLNLASDNLMTADDAKIAITHAKAAIDKINAMLPSELRGDALKKFIELKNINQSEKSNKFYVASMDDSKIIMQSLVHINHLLTKNLNDLLNVANIAVAGAHTPEEMQNLDMQFQANKNELVRALAAGCQIRDIKIFNGNKLVSKMEGRDREYVFTKLDLDVLNLKNDSILDATSGNKSLNDLWAAVSWTRDWMIFGNTTISSVKRKNTLADSSFLKLKASVR